MRGPLGRKSQYPPETFSKALSDLLWKGGVFIFQIFDDSLRTLGRDLYPMVKGRVIIYTPNILCSNSLNLIMNYSAGRVFYESCFLCKKSDVDILN